VVKAETRQAGCSPPIAGSNAVRRGP